LTVDFGHTICLRIFFKMVIIPSQLLRLVRKRMKKIFISYSHRDEKWKQQLVKQLEVLQMQGDVQVWDDRKIKAGDNWFQEIQQALTEAEAAVLLISADFLTSGFILTEEVPALFRQVAGQKKKIFPLIIHPCPWQEIDWLKEIQARPIDGKPLSGFTKYQRETILADFAVEIKNILNKSEKPGPEAAHDQTGKGKGKSKITETQQVSTYKMPTTGEFLLGREKELNVLDAAWEDEHTHIVILAAWGGVGKTALVNRWLNRMEKDNYRGAQRVYAWSFYSQGAEEGKQASADEFMQETLGWFGDEDPTAGSTVDKGRRLARLLRKEKTLLILDGLEPLQYPPGQVQGLDGKLKDQGMHAFLREIAGGFNGLCLVTSREKLTDLADKKNYTVQELELEHLSQEAGAELLKCLGVTGREKDILNAAAEYDGHALALTLLGQYLKSTYQGDICKRDRIPRLTKERIRGGHARRVMAAYEKWFGESAEKDILYIMGLFDQPVETGAVEALKVDPAVPGVTERLRHITEEDWNNALVNLRTAQLLARENPHKRYVLDCHPLVREHFGERLREKNPDGWRECHRRLYHYFKELPGKELPDTLPEMEPLFAAIAHGCRAGLYQEALYDEYYKRIQRDGEKNYCCKQLGAFGADLAALSHFFEVPWSRPAAELKEDKKALVLSWAAFRLHTLGRLREALQPMKAGLEMNVKDENWLHAAMNASNLSALLLTLGEVSEAVEYGSRSVTHADRSVDAFLKEATLTTHADALHQAGQLEQAEALFRDAEALQRERQPGFPILYSLAGFRFCDLLLGRASDQEVRERAEKFFEWRQPSDSLLTISLDNLIAGRAWMMHAGKERTRDFQRAAAYLDRAVEGLRESGDQDILTLGLIKRAACYRHQGLFTRAREDLQEAKEIADQGDMKLHLVDYHLEAGRLSWPKTNPRKPWNISTPPLT